MKRILSILGAVILVSSFTLFWQLREPSFGAPVNTFIKYVSSTAVSADILCLTGDLPCRSTWPTGGSGTNDWGAFGITYRENALKTSSTYPVWIDDNLYVSSTAYFGDLRAINATSTYLSAHVLSGDTSDGLLFEANNGTDVAIFGAGNSANATFYGGVNIDGQTRLATSLTGLAYLTSGVVSARDSISLINIFATNVSSTFASSTYASSTQLTTGNLTVFNTADITSSTFRGLTSNGSTNIILGLDNASAPKFRVNTAGDIIANLGGGSVTLGGLPVDRSYAGLWLAQSSPSASNYLLLGSSQQSFINAPNSGTADIELRIGNGTAFSVGALGAGVLLSGNTAPTKPFEVKISSGGATAFTIESTGIGTFSSGLISAASSTFSRGLQVTGRLTSSSTAYLTQGFISNASSSVGGDLVVSGALQVAGGTTLTNVTSTYATSTFLSVTTSTIAGGLFQTGLTSCNADNQTLAYNATTGKFECGDDDTGGAGSFSGFLSSAYYVTNGVTTSTLRANGLYISTSTANMLGLFNVDSNGNVSASGSLYVYGSGTEIFGSLQVDGDTYLAGTTLIGGQTDITNNLGVTGTLSVGNELFASNTLYIGQRTGFNAGSFNVDGLTGNTSVSGTLQTYGLADFNIGFISNASSSIGSSLNVSGALNASSTLAVSGLSTFSSGLLITSSSYSGNSPLFSISTTTSWGNLIQIFATSSVQQHVSTTYNYDSGLRFSFGSNNQFSQTGFLDQLTVQGRINTTNWMSQDLNTIAADLNAAASNIGGTAWSFVRSAGMIQHLNDTSGITYLRICNDTANACNNTAVAANTGGGVFLPNSSSQGYLIASTTPILDVYARINRASNATSSFFVIGMSNINTAANLGRQPTTGCFFETSSTAMTWFATCAKAGISTTTINTNIVSTTNPTGAGDFYHFRLEMDNAKATFYMGTPNSSFKKITTITNNFSTTTAYRIHAYHGRQTTAGLMQALDISSLKFWWNQPFVNY